MNYLSVAIYEKGLYSRSRLAFIHLDSRVSYPRSNSISETLAVHVANCHKRNVLLSFEHSKAAPVYSGLVTFNRRISCFFTLDPGAVPQIPFNQANLKTVVAWPCLKIDHTC